MTKPTNINKIIFSILLVIYFILVTKPWSLYFLNDDFVHIPLSAETVWIHFQFFRPVANLLTAFEVKVFDTNPLGFHITSFLLHLASTFCVGVLCRELIRKYGNTIKYKHADYAAACLFFIYPFHSEPVMWIIGRIGIIATLFSLVSIIFFMKQPLRPYFYVLSILSFIIALFSYEIAWMVPVFITVLTLVDYYKTREYLNKRVFYLLPYWFLLAAFIFIRYIALQQVFNEYVMRESNLSITSLTGKFSHLLARTVVPPAENTIEFVIIFFIIGLVLLGLIIFMARRKAITILHLLLASFLVISYLPVVSIGIDTHGSEGERYLYLPSVFWIMLLTILLYGLSQKIRKYGFCVIIVIYSLLLKNAASNYQHASLIAKNILSLIDNHPVSEKIIAINIPANYKGAMIFRSGFKEAIDWIHPHAYTDSVIVIPADRTYDKISLRIKNVAKNELNRIGLKAITTDNKNYTLYFKTYVIQYNSQKDILLFFNEKGEAIVIYP